MKIIVITCLYLSFAVPCFTQEYFKVDDLIDARNYGREAFDLLQKTQPLLDSCKKVNESFDRVKCLYKAETQLNAAFEAIDNSYFDIDRSLEYAQAKKCKDWEKGLGQIRLELNETVADINEALDLIRSAEKDLSPSKMNSITGLVSEEIDQAFEDIQKAGNSWENFMRKQFKCD